MSWTLRGREALWMCTAAMEQSICGPYVVLKANILDDPFGNHVRNDDCILPCVSTGTCWIDIKVSLSMYIILYTIHSCDHARLCTLPIGCYCKNRITPEFVLKFNTHSAHPNSCSIMLWHSLVPFSTFRRQDHKLSQWNIAIQWRWHNARASLPR